MSGEGPRVADVQVQVQAKALGDPTRYRIFRYVADAGRPVGVAELTEHIGFNHNAIRQHLAQLVEARLVVESVATASGRGRPPLQYVVDPGADSRWAVVGPYERLSGWLAEIVRTGDSAFEVGRRVGFDRPPVRSAADVGVPGPAAALIERMAHDGFAPASRRRGSTIEITLTHCPFASTALADPGTVCELHHGIAVGVAERVGGVVVDALVPTDPRRAACRLRCHVEPDATAAE